jgi:cobaltochelatase CobS
VGRGKDTKPRIRRTKAEVLAMRVNSGEISRADAESELGRRFTDGEIAGEVIGETEEIQTESKPQSNEDKKSMDAIDYIPMEQEETDEPSGEVNTVDVEALVTKIARRVTANVTDTLYADLEVRTQNIMKQVKQLATNKPVVMAVKIGDADIKKLKHAAHPKLGELLLKIKLKYKSPLLVGPAGCGKSLLAEQAAEALGLEYDHICFSAGASETWLFGRQTPNGFVEGGFSRLYEKGGVFLADELDAADANLLMALNTAIAGHAFKNPISGRTIERHPDFVFIGAANTFGKGANAVYTGRNRLDGASLNRFTVIIVDYDKSVEKSLCPDDELRSKIQDLRNKLKQRGASEIISYRDMHWAYLLKEQGGWSVKDAVADLIQGWPDALCKELGVA